MRHQMLGFGLLLAAVMLRVILLECTQGNGFRAAADKPLSKARSVPAARGRILSRDGVLLAGERRVPALAVNYRLLEEPVNERWLRQQARARVPRDAAKRRARIEAEEASLRQYRQELLAHLAQLCGRRVEELQAQSRRIQTRVQATSAAVNSARLNAHSAAIAARTEQFALDRDAPGLWHRFLALAPWIFASDEPQQPRPITVAEELDEHVLVSNVPLEVVAHVESHRSEYPGLRIVEQSQRYYPAGPLAAPIVGHLGPADPSDRTKSRTSAVDRVGRLGIEREWEDALRGTDGRMVELSDHGGRLLETIEVARPASGRDVTLSIDARLQRAAETALDHALARVVRSAAENDDAKSNLVAAPTGAIVVMDVHSGAMLAAASAPRFNPNVFADADAEAIASLLRDPGHPLFDRAARMAIPPGSVFKIVTALALLSDPSFNPQMPFECQGFFAEPDRLRCQLFRRSGLGHGATDLTSALARSCNVYFFHHAATLGAAPICDWAGRLGFGQPTGVDLPSEAAGRVPAPDRPSSGGRAWSVGDTQALAIGQSTLRVTPLQAARALAAIANGGYLVTPYLTADLGGAMPDETPSDATDGRLVRAPRLRVAGLDDRRLGIVRGALRRVVDDPEGTAFATLSDCEIAIAGKTGTAESGANTADHAWFAGYLPAEAPRWAVVVVLEQGGPAEGATIVAKQVAQSMRSQGLLTVPAARDVADGRNSR